VDPPAVVMQAANVLAARSAVEMGEGEALLIAVTGGVSRSPDFSVSRPDFCHRPVVA
jgi:hypothetical protein